MDMTVQPLRRFAPPLAPRFAPMWARRALILGGTVILTAAGCYEMYSVLKVGGITVLELIILALFVLLFAWIAFSFVSALAGFAVLLFRKKDELGIDPATPLHAIRSRTAMLLPTYNEDPYRVLARLRAIYELVEETGHGTRFRLVCPERHHGSHDLDRRGKVFSQAPTGRRERGQNFLSPSPRKHRPQIRQYRAMDTAVRLRL